MNRLMGGKDDIFIVSLLEEKQKIWCQMPDNYSEWDASFDKIVQHMGMGDCTNYQGILTAYAN